MAPELLRVDTTRLVNAGQNFQSAAAAIPPAPAAFVPTGADALSAAIAAQAPGFIAPIAAGLPILRAQTTQYGQKVASAANIYQTADAQLADRILQQLFGGPTGQPPAPGGPATAVGAVGAIDPIATGVASPPSAAGAPGLAGAAQPAGQLGQLGQMPMQMASQAAQAPMQTIGMATSAPQGLMQAGQAAAQPVSQLAGQVGGTSRGGGGPTDDPDGDIDPSADIPAGETGDNPDDRVSGQGATGAGGLAGAAPAAVGTERVPEPLPAPRPRHAAPADPVDVLL
jgi:hypothetical protein